MGYEQKDNSGSIFANDKKEGANHPDGKGSAMIGGIEYWVSSWNKKTQEGKPWRSIAFTPKDAKPMSKQAPKDAKPKSKQDEFEDSDIPF
jgi:hypothetical protein